MKGSANWKALCRGSRLPGSLSLGEQKMGSVGLLAPTWRAAVRSGQAHETGLLPSC